MLQEGAFEVALRSALAFDGETVSATQDALDGRSNGAPKIVLRDLYKDVPESLFEVELKGAL